MRSVMNQLTTSVAFGHASISAFEVAGVVDVVVADEHPAHVLGLDEAEHVVEVLLAVLGDAGVDDDRLGAADHHAS